MKGFHRIAVCSPRLKLGDPAFNASRIADLYRCAASRKAAVVAMPELALTGSTCGDVFAYDVLLDKARECLEWLVKETKGSRTVLLAGLPMRVCGRLLDVVAVVQNGRLAACVPRCGDECPPVDWPYGRLFHFPEAGGISPELRKGLGWTEEGPCIPVFDCGNGFVFSCAVGVTNGNVPLARMSLVHDCCTMALNCTAGAETIGEPGRRRAMAAMESARLGCVVARAAAGVHESTSEYVCSGHLVVAEGGRVAAENSLFEPGDSIVFHDLNAPWLAQKEDGDSRGAASLQSGRVIELEETPMAGAPEFAEIEPLPFVPAEAAERAEYCNQVLQIQAAALAERVVHTHARRLVIGISGGLDSTLALLAAVRCCDLLKKGHDFVLAVTMPGMGTTDRTRNNAADMARLLGVDLRSISIRKAVLQHFKDIGHEPDVPDIVYENSQARERTQILMDLANGEGGLVIGTGDLSEIALGWCTFNGDHISMYCINCGVPKTLIRAVVENEASKATRELAAILRDINETPVSPELLPGAQQTENILGSYELHDFYLYHFIRHHESPEAIRDLARRAFRRRFPAAEIDRTLTLFFKRFFAQQFKRNAAPEGPAVCGVSLSCHGGWVMPSDMGGDLWKNDTNPKGKD